MSYMSTYPQKKYIGW